MTKFVSIQSVLQNAQPQDLSCETKGLGGGFPNKRIQDFWAQDTLLAGIFVAKYSCLFICSDLFNQVLVSLKQRPA